MLLLTFTCCVAEANETELVPGAGNDAFESYSFSAKTPLGGCFINCGWGTGGFKAIPGSGWAMAEMMAKGEPGPLAAAFGLERFREGRFIDESVAAGVAH
ncbi:hypothetical protein JT55_18235 [Rhodovulum sp. NI22]|nr:hypothetical protein JT55_18235 [Rhodovulum sp. NI22]